MANQKYTIEVWEFDGHLKGVQCVCIERQQEIVTSKGDTIPDALHQIAFELERMQREKARKADE